MCCHCFKLSVIVFVSAVFTHDSIALFITDTLNHSFQIFDDRGKVILDDFLQIWLKLSLATFKKLQSIANVQRWFLTVTKKCLLWIKCEFRNRYYCNFLPVLSHKRSCVLSKIFHKSPWNGLRILLKQAQKSQ